MIEKVPLTSQDVRSERIAWLRETFPEAFTEGKVDLERLGQILGDEALGLDGAAGATRERYGLSWAGRAEAVRNLQAQSVATLVPDREESVDFDSTQNLFIEGDNLEVLKLLQKAYHGRVKMIYIDPPYNTGNEFIYPDDFREGIEGYLRYSGQADGEGMRLTTNTETGGRYHSRWLTMMYPRLALARNLLREDGVIFVSIDDHEVHNLRLLMNEVFGEENFLATFVWKRRSGAMDAVSNVSSDHEYVVCFGRTQMLLRGQERTFERYTNPDGDERGPWIADNLSAAKPGGDTYYAVTDPDTGHEYWPPKGRYWPYSRTTMNRKVEEGRIIFPGTPSGMPLLKRFKNEAKSVFQPVSTWIAPAAGKPKGNGSEPATMTSSLNAEGTREIKDLFGDKVFTYPKPTSLLRALIDQGTSKADDIVLDFFAGSATTAHAVLEQNRSDGGRRRFIMVQLPEATDNPDYPTIAGMGRERIRRAAGTLNGRDADELGAEDAPRQDRGFRAFRLASSNFKVWDGDAASGEPQDLAQQLLEFAENTLPGRSREHALYEVLLKSGFPLTAVVKKLEVAGRETYSVADGLLLVCLEDRIDEELLRAVAAREPQRFVCLDAAFDGNDTLKTNAVLQMRDRGIEFRTV